VVAPVAASAVPDGLPRARLRCIRRVGVLLGASHRLRLLRVVLAVITHDYRGEVQVWCLKKTARQNAVTRAAWPSLAHSPCLSLAALSSVHSRLPPHPHLPFRACPSPASPAPPFALPPCPALPLLPHQPRPSCCHPPLPPAIPAPATIPRSGLAIRFTPVRPLWLSSSFVGFPLLLLVVFPPPPVVSSCRPHPPLAPFRLARSPPSLVFGLVPVFVSCPTGASLAIVTSCLVLSSCRSSRPVAGRSASSLRSSLLPPRPSLLVAARRCVVDRSHMRVVHRGCLLSCEGSRSRPPARGSCSRLFHP
jgi:hypothetical protein